MSEFFKSTVEHEKYPIGTIFIYNKSKCPVVGYHRDERQLCVILPEGGHNGSCSVDRDKKHSNLNGNNHWFILPQECSIDKVFVTKRPDSFWDVVPLP